MKLADHADDRLHERTDLPDEVLNVLRKRINGVELPHGTHHTVLPDGSYAVVKEVGKNKPKHVVATVLGKNMSPPGEDITHLVYGGRIGERMNSEAGFGPKRKHEAHSHFKQYPNGYESSSSFSEVKVAALDTYAGQRLKTLLYPKNSIQKHMARMRGELEIVHIDLNKLPLIPPMENDHPSVEREFFDMMQIMEDRPLSESMIRKADEDILGIFLDVCNMLDVDTMAQDVEIILEDLSKIALRVKYAFMRPRPEMLAPFFGKKIQPFDTDSADTPSYPSGHAMAGYGLAKFYAELYPQFVDQFYAAADSIALSRIQAGLHLPSDTSYAKMLADFIFGPDTRAPKVPKRLHVENPANLAKRVNPEPMVSMDDLMLEDIEPPKQIKDDLDVKTASINSKTLSNSTIRGKTFNNLEKLLRGK